MMPKERGTFFLSFLLEFFSNYVVGSACAILAVRASRRVQLDSIGGKDVKSVDSFCLEYLIKPFTFCILFTE